MHATYASCYRLTILLTKLVICALKAMSIPNWIALQGRIQDFFLGGGALVSCSTSFFFCRIPVVLENHRSSQGGGGGGAHPLHPPPRSASGSCAKTQTVLKRVLLTRKNGYFSTIFVTEQSCPPRQYLNYIRAFYISDGFLYRTLVQRDQIFGP